MATRPRGLYFRRGDRQCARLCRPANIQRQPAGQRARFQVALVSVPGPFGRADAFPAAGVEPGGETGCREPASRCFTPACLATSDPDWAGGSILATILGILSQAGQSNGAELALPWAPVILTLLSTTHLGLIWLVRLALALLSIWFAMGRPAAWKDWLGYGTALGLMLSVSLTAHAATEAQPVLPVIDDCIHILGMTVWLGGLAYLLTGLRTIAGLEARLHTRLISLSMGRFSGMALAAWGRSA